MAGGAGEIRAGAAYVELFVKGNVGPQLDALHRKLKNFGDSITSIGKRWAAVGAAFVVTSIAAARHFASVGDEINKASQRTGIAVEALSELKYAAQQSAVGFDELEGGVRHMSKTIFDAADHVTSAKASLAGLGLTVKDLQGLSIDDQFTMIADKLSQVSDQGARAAIAMEIFGKGGVKLMPLINGGAEGIDQLRERARQLGLVIGKDDAEAATRFGDALDDLKSQISAVTFQAGAAIARALQPFADVAIRTLAGVIKWAGANRELFLSILLVGGGLLVAGASLLAFGYAVKLVGAALGAALSLWKLAATAVDLLLNPIVLITAGLAALAGYFIFTTKAGGQALAWLGEQFDALKATAITALGGIADALQAGDISLAAQILWAALKLEWNRGARALWDPLVETFYAAKSIIQDGWAILVGNVERLWSYLREYLSNWDGVKAAMRSLWEYFKHIASPAINAVADALSREMIQSEAEFDVKAKYRGRTLNDKDAETIVAPYVQEQAEQIKAANKGASQADLDKMLQANADRINAWARDRFSGKQLSDEDLGSLIARETEFQQQQRDAGRGDLQNQQDAAFKAKLDEIDAEFRKNNPDLAARGDAEQARIGAEEQAARDSNIQELQAALKNIDPSRVKEIAELEAQLATLREQAASEKKKADEAEKRRPKVAPTSQLDDILAQRDAVKAPAQAAGIFNAAAIQTLQVGVSSANEQTARNTAATAKAVITGNQIMRDMQRSFVAKFT